MDPIEFRNKENPDYENQLNFLIKREFFITYSKFRKLPLYLIVATSIVPAFILMTPPDNFITAKAILFLLLALVWAIAIFISVSILLKWINRQKWKRNSIALAKADTIGYKLHFDHEKIFFETPTYKSELLWEYYAYWIENRKSIFIFPKSNLYDALYYSETDLGAEIYLKLKSIAATKLTKLDE